MPRGYAAPFPTKYQFDEEEFERIAELAKLQLDDAKEDLEEAKKAERDEDEAPKEKKSSGKGGASVGKQDDADEMDEEFVATIAFSFYK